MPSTRTLLLAMALAISPVASQLQQASSVCVYNAAAVVLRWRLRDVASGREIKQDHAYPVGQVRCLQADALNVSTGSKLVPIIDAVWGKEVQGSEPMFFNGANASQITYVCHGVTFDFSCKPDVPPPTAVEVAKDTGKFLLGFTEGLLLSVTGIGSCLKNLDKTYTDIKTMAMYFEHGINGRTSTKVIKAFEIAGKLLLDFGNSIATCVTGNEDVVQMLLGLAAWLGGGVLKVIQIVVDEALHILHNIVDITHDCKAIASDWQVGDYFGSGKALGDLVGIIAKDLKPTVTASGKLQLMPPASIQLMNATSTVVV